MGGSSARASFAVKRRAVLVRPPAALTPVLPSAGKGRDALQSSGGG